MILPRREDAIHKMQLLRLLSRILDDPTLSQNVYFKGGTCASMLGYLDRFSIDLDFDLSEQADKKLVDHQLRLVFQQLDLKVDAKSAHELFYVLKYKSKTGRNSLKLGIVSKQGRSNVYKSFYLPEIDRFAICQTIETMFSHKLVAPIDRFQKYKSIAGRDIYNIHHFFLKGYGYIEAIIEERTGRKAIAHLQQLKDFIEKKVKDKALSEDLNYLLPNDTFQKIRKILKKETILLLSDEIKRFQKK